MSGGTLAEDGCLRPGLRWIVVGFGIERDLFMIIKIGKHHVDVLDAKCKDRYCYELWFDKGVYAQGRGYTNYYKKPLPVCWTRHINGCPAHSVCPEC